MKFNFTTILILISVFAKGQFCDSLVQEGIDQKHEISYYEELVAEGCDAAKLALAFQLSRGYCSETDSSRAFSLVLDCSANNINCEYELFMYYWDGMGVHQNRSTALKVISSLGLKMEFQNYWDSVMVANARLITAGMYVEGNGTDTNYVEAMYWYILYYEIQDVWYDPERQLEDIAFVETNIDNEQMKIAIEKARVTLGRRSEYELIKDANKK